MGPDIHKNKTPASTKTVDRLTQTYGPDNATITTRRDLNTEDGPLAQQMVHTIIHIVTSSLEYALTTGRSLKITSEQTHTGIPARDTPLQILH